MKQLVSSTRNNLSQVERNILNTNIKLNDINKYNLATGKLKKKYVKKQQELTTLEKIQRDFKLLNK